PLPPRLLEGPDQLLAARPRRVAQYPEVLGVGEPGSSHPPPLVGAFRPQALQLLAHALAQPPHRPGGAAQLGADLLGRVALEAQLDDRPLIGTEPAKQLFDGFGEGGGLLGGGLTPGCLAPRLGAVGCRRGLAGDVAALGLMIAGAVGALPQGND